MLINIGKDSLFITVIDDQGFKGTAKIKWVKENKWSAAHYEALITVPFKNSHWENLFVYNKDNINTAIKKAKEILEYHLSRCTLI